MAKTNAEKQKEYRERKKAELGVSRRHWMLICYPDSMPPEWRELMSQMHLPVWVSPLHDADTWTVADERKDARHKAGVLKKPHYHLIAEYPSPVFYNQFLEDFKWLNGPSKVEYVKSLNSMVRYLIHLDDPDKAQYKREDISVFCGADAGIIDQLGESETEEAIADMMMFIDSHGITSYAAFMRYCRDNDRKWFRLLLKSCTYCIKEYIKSCRYDMLDEMRAAESGRR